MPPKTTGQNWIEQVTEQRFVLLALTVISLAALNLFNRLGLETVTEWDESLYATSAAEMLQNGQWAATTFAGTIDYSNSKPPLNVWLIAISFKLFGINLWSMRLASAFSGLATVALLMFWLRHAHGAALAIMAGVVLSTCFGFYYVHSSRTANPDALFALLALAIVVTLFFAAHRPSLVLWLGPMLAAAFLLKGFGAFLHALVALVCAAIWLRGVITWRLTVVTMVIATIPIGAWAYARWQVDGSTFFRVMVAQDLIGISLEPLDSHRGSSFFYLDVLQKYQYDWILAAIATFLLYLPSRDRILAMRPAAWPVFWRLTGGASATLLLVPTLMQTKVSWYGNPLLPFFSIAIAAIVLRSMRRSARGLRQFALIAIVLTAAATAQSRLFWHSHHRRDLASSDQGLLLSYAAGLSGHSVFRADWTHADRFVATHLIGCEQLRASGHAEFLARSEPGDFWLQRRSGPPVAAEPIYGNARFLLFQR
jgi:4-amino-4-deoxy-L-arabinose transferase-like glycosyltransferase